MGIVDWDDLKKRIKLVRRLGQNVRATRAVQAEWRCFADSENRILSNIATKKLKLIFRSPKFPETQNACYLMRLLKLTNLSLTADLLNSHTPAS